MNECRVEDVGRPLAAILLFVILALLPACTQASPAPTPITLQLRWTHQAQFGGFYAADQNGYYADEGLDVSFTEGGPDVDLITPVIDGAAHFGVAGAEALILARADGQPVRAIATIYRRSPIVFFALAESGISRPQDFVGKKIRVTDDMLPSLRTMLARIGISRDQYTEMHLDGRDMGPLYSGEVPVWSGFVNGAALRVQKAGHDINMVFPDDYGVHFYADTLFTTDEFVSENPELITRFLRATLEGWTYAAENASKIGPMVLAYDPEADPEQQTDSMLASLPLIHTGQDHIGWMQPDVWAEMEQILREQNVLSKPVDVSEVFTLEFLSTIY